MKRITTILFLLLFTFALQGQKVLMYGGKVLTVISYDANQPLNINTTCEVWLDGKDDQSFTLTGALVDQWNDKSGNNRHVKNENANDTRPEYSSTTGRVTFVAANGTFLQSGDFGGDLSQPNTVFIVSKFTAHNNDGQLFNGRILAKRNQIYEGAANFSLYAGVVLGDGARDLDNHIHTALFNGASTEYWIDGVSKVIGNAGAHVLSGITLGALPNLADNGDAEIMEVIVYNSDISDRDRDVITAYLANKWSITATTDFKGYVLTNTAVSTAAWASPTGKENDAWTDAANIYDGNILTSGQESTNGHSVTLTIASISCNKVRINAGRVAGGQADLKIEVYYSAAFHTIHDGVLTEDTWVEIDVGSTEDITKAKITTNDGINSEVWEFEFWSL